MRDHQTNVTMLCPGARYSKNLPSASAWIDCSVLFLLKMTSEARLLLVHKLPPAGRRMKILKKNCRMRLTPHT